MRSLAVLGSCGKRRLWPDAEQFSAPQCLDCRREVGCSRAVEPFEPVLIEKRGEGRLPECRLPYDPEERGRRLILLPRQRRQNRGALGRVTIECVGARPEPELDEASPLGWGQCEMRDLVQGHIRLGRAVQCRSVPIEAAWGSLRVNRHAEPLRERECCKTMPLCLRAAGAIGRGGANSR